MQDHVSKLQLFHCDLVVLTFLSRTALPSDFLSTASNSLGVLFAVSTTTGATLEAISWEEMRDPT